MRKQIRTDALRSSFRFLDVPAAILMACFVVSAHAASNALRDAAGSRIVVTDVAGDVDVTMAGNAADVAPAQSLLLPARIVTGEDGTIGLTQAGTNINVSNDSEVEIPAEAVDGNLVARLVQHRGNVFYDVAPRDAGKLRVETPLLVAVIKGTQFNVAVQPDSTTISLFEGRLEILTPDGSDTVQLNAGEIAIRSLTDVEIRVVGMNDERVAAPRAERPSLAAAVDDAAAEETRLRTAVVIAADGASREALAAAKPADQVGGSVDAALALDKRSVALGSSADLGVGDIAVGGAVDVVLDAGIDLGRAAVDLGLDTGVELDGGKVDLGLDAGADLGGATVDLGLDAGVDLGGGSVDLGLDTRVDLGGTTVDVGLDAGVDLGGGAADLGLDTGVDLGGTTVDLGLDAGLDLGGALDAGVDAAVDLGLVDTSVDAGIDVGSGGVDLGLDVGGVLDVGLDVDLAGGTLDLDLGLGGGGATPPAAPPRGGLGGLLGGLL